VIATTQRRFDLVQVVSGDFWQVVGPSYIRARLTDELLREVWKVSHVAVPFSDVKVTGTKLNGVVPQSRLRRLFRRLLRRPALTWRYIELHASVVVWVPVTFDPLVVQ